ncbi:Sulfur carrier protein ThiS [Arsenophonus endosymbiont of Aleurodicus dispersus]|uniref:sulfur carrier protein ThiS n=1 Tax=Arsenophonus endosymbiont of Aleurodicus dispersus TaxID=235559 RepID=UPI000EB3D4A2|nr:sulfur carrier protein ThiS [Arsenophonus endosymbiont of Aleurodicus dispersus]VAY02487.1 Sulfur carrier protein ThiS [Arsenophonus endosymbiont of Aleurodicus dispersus]
MHITLNDQQMALNGTITIAQLFDHLKINKLGIAIAINQIIIAREDWNHHYINHQDKILLFQAIAGG